MVIRHTKVLKGLGAVVLGVMVASPAWADCGPVIAAFRKAEASGRFAWFKVSDPNQAPIGDAIMISIGENTYVPVEGGSRYKGKYQTTGLLKGVLANSLERHERDGKASCKPLVDRMLRGEMAAGFNVVGGVEIGESGQPSEDVWISRATGLPIIQGMDSTGHGGVAWIYGAAVNAPPPAKLL